MSLAPLRRPGASALTSRLFAFVLLATAACSGVGRSPNSIEISTAKTGTVFCQRDPAASPTRATPMFQVTPPSARPAPNTRPGDCNRAKTEVSGEGTAAAV